MICLDLLKIAENDKMVFDIASSYLIQPCRREPALTAAVKQPHFSDARESVAEMPCTATYHVKKLTGRCIRRCVQPKAKQLKS